MNQQLITRVLKTAILPPGESVYSERATYIEIEDDGGGEFVSIHQEESDGNVRIDSAEWPIIRDAINAAFEEIAKHEKP